MSAPSVHPSANLSDRLARISVEQYHRMIESGALRESAAIELLDGLLVQKDRSARGDDPRTVGKRHAVAVHRLLVLDALLTKFGWHMRVQSPVTFVSANEPEPDGAIARGADSAYLERHPGAADLACVFEVADSSLDHDRTLKLAAYARAGVRLYVIVNLVDNRLEVHEEPDATTGSYRKTASLVAGEVLTVLLGGDGRIDLPVRDLLP